MMEHKRFAEILLLDCDALREPTLYAAAYESVDAARRAKIDAWKTEENRRLSLGVGLLAHFLLRKEGIGPERLLFREDGKPVIVGGGYHISLSHAGDWAMVGLSDAPIAVDVERHRPDEWGIAAHFFTQAEKEAIAAATDPEPLFWRLWSRKECLVKLDGLRDPRELPALEAPPRMRFWDHPLPGYSCVACTSAEREPAFRIIEPDEIMTKS